MIHRVPRKKAEKFNAAVKAFVLDQGGMETGQYMYELALETKAGRLLISASDDWVACCFDDVELAKKVLPTIAGHQPEMNRYSGKWNFHGADGDDNLDSFVEAVKPLLH